MLNDYTRDLTVEEKRQLWNVLDHDLSSEEDPELLAGIDEAIRSMERGEKTYTIEEVREHIAEVVEKSPYEFSRLMYTVIFSKSADKDIVNIVKYVAAENPQAAQVCG
jgi:hypothetical protein